MKQWNLAVTGVLGWLLLSGTAQAQLLPDFEMFRSRTPRLAPEAQAREQLRAECKTAYEQGDYEKSAALATQVIAADPTHPLGYYYRASARIEIGKSADSAKQVREGIADAREALRLGGNVSHLLYIPYLYGLTSLSELEGRRDHAELAIKTVTPVLQQPTVSRTNLSFLYYQRALAHGTLLDYKAAAADDAEAIRLNPQLQAAYSHEAHAYASAGNQVQARASFDRAVEAFPRSFLAYNERGSFHLAMGEYDAAVRDFTRAVQLDPQFALGFANRGITLNKQQAAKQAERDFRQALQLDPDQPLYYRLLANCEVAQGQAKSALVDFAKLITLAPQDAEAHGDRGCARFYLNDFGGAAADFEKALQFSPTLKSLELWLAVALLRQGKEDAAKSRLQAWLKTKPDPRDAWASQIAGFLVGDRSDAELLAAAQGADPRAKSQLLCEAHFYIGQKLAAAGQAEEAAAHFRECLKTGAFEHAAFTGARYALGDFSGK